MSRAVEFLSGPQVLLLRVYAQLKPAERRAAVDNVKMHGCYHQGVPLLINSSESGSPEGTTNMDALRDALSSALLDSPIAVVVRVASSLPDKPLTRDGPVFAARADALRWLAGQ